MIQWISSVCRGSRLYSNKRIWHVARWWTGKCTRFPTRIPLISYFVLRLFPIIWGTWLETKLNKRALKSNSSRSFNSHTSNIYLSVHTEIFYKHTPIEQEQRDGSCSFSPFSPCSLSSLHPHSFVLQNINILISTSYQQNWRWSASPSLLQIWHLKGSCRCSWIVAQWLSQLLQLARGHLQPDPHDSRCFHSIQV
jgi:hypothetical protein